MTALLDHVMSMAVEDYMNNDMRRAGDCHCERIEIDVTWAEQWHDNDIEILAATSHPNLIEYTHMRPTSRKGYSIEVEYDGYKTIHTNGCFHDSSQIAQRWRVHVAIDNENVVATDWFPMTTGGRRFIEVMYSAVVKCLMKAELGIVVTEVNTAPIDKLYESG